MTTRKAKTMSDLVAELKAQNALTEASLEKAQQFENKSILMGDVATDAGEKVEELKLLLRVEKSRANEETSKLIRQVTKTEHAEAEVRAVLKRIGYLEGYIARANQADNAPYFDAKETGAYGPYVLPGSVNSY
jgi:hypothetical protein